MVLRCLRTLFCLSLCQTGVTLVHSQQNAIGNPCIENGWSSTSAILVRSSSQHATQTAVNLINGQGTDETGQAIGNSSLFVTGNLSESKGNPRGGTVGGGHWVEFEFDENYSLGEMWIWNYNGVSQEYDWRKLGFRNITVQYSENGGIDPADWKIAYEGEVPLAMSSSPDFLAQVSLVIDFHGARARYVVITTADAPEHNRMEEGNDAENVSSQAGLGAVRFFVRDAANPKTSAAPKK